MLNIDLQKIKQRLCLNGALDVQGILTSSGIIPIDLDTKVVSHIIQQIIGKEISEQLGSNIIPAAEQNHYPDFSIMCGPIALDVKTSYRKTATQINGFTLGSYGGYFGKESKKNCTLPYNSYTSHWVLGVIYSRVAGQIKDIDLILREKWQIASRKQGSGNTKNIGSIKSIADLKSDKTIFSSEDEFTSYWMNYKSAVVIE